MCLAAYFRVTNKSMFETILCHHNKEVSNMQFHIISSLGVCLSEKGFSLDELIHRLDDLFKNKAFPEIIAGILMIFDEWLKVLVMKKAKLPFSCGCGGDEVALCGTYARSFHSQLGTVKLPALTRVRCPFCGRRFVPLLEMVGFEKYQTKTAGAEKAVVEQCVAQSYRRAEKSLNSLTGLHLDHSTYHRWVLKTDADEIKVPEDTVAAVPGNARDAKPPAPVTLFADGTKCKGKDTSGNAAQGDVKVLLGIRQSGSVFPIGTWTGHETWAEIGRQLERQKVKFPDGSILVCDGELGLAEGLASIAAGQQRCQWHIVRDTYHSMWQDGGRTPAIGPVQDRLRRIMAIELPKESFETVPEEKKNALRMKTDEAEKEMDRLISEVRKGGFEKAGNYLERAKSAMFSYVRRWLALGIACPRASSFIERTMRELGLRLKKMAYGWKDAGLKKVSNILLKMFADDDAWQTYWKRRMELDRAVFLHFKLIKR